MKLKKIGLLCAALILSAFVKAGDVSIPNTFVNGNVADANEVNANFDAVAGEINDNDARLDLLEQDIVLEPLQAFYYNIFDTNTQGYQSDAWTPLAYTQFSFEKGAEDSNVKITWTDTARSSYGSCSWHLTVDDQACSPAPLLRVAYGSSAVDVHSSSSIIQVCSGLSAGTHSLQVYVNRSNNGQCMRGWGGNINPPFTVNNSYPASILVEEFAP